MSMFSSKVFKNCKKGLKTFITSNHIILCKTRISFSNELKISSPPKSGNNVVSMFIVSAIAIVKGSNKV
jgi:hypothetical protein